MSCDQKQWSCGKAGAVNFQRVGSIVRDIGEPCLSQSPIKVVIIPVSRMLKPDKWQATFDSEGKISGFHKALKLIALGGVDPAIRAEVWEFLLGCYALGSTAEHRRELRTARREHYSNLVQQCQAMHSSVGTGVLAYVVGSKVMDMRISSKTEGGEAKVKNRRSSIDPSDIIENYSDCNNNCTETSCACERESSNDSAELDMVRESTDSAAYDSSCFIPASGTYTSGYLERGDGARASNYLEESIFDFPALPVTNLFKQEGDETECSFHDVESSGQRKLRSEDNRMHSFHIDNNIDLIIESSGSGSPSNNAHHENSEIEVVRYDDRDPVLQSNNQIYEKEISNRLRISDAPESSLNAASQGGATGEDRVSEWLWTLHRIVVDVVRTDSHLEFYEDKKNLARMSDILAVYAWVDPATGYCQGMSDLLSPFVVLFEDDGDAFWCFEMLLRRMRDNFQMEGPTGVMKQLKALWHILECMDREMFAHLSRIGAESLHFAFRMLMVLFRRELSFNEALRMWEMMWAADFDESLASDLEENCLEALVLHVPVDTGEEMRDESKENGNGSSHGREMKYANNVHSVSEISPLKSASAHPFCGLTRSFWSRSEPIQISTIISSTKNGDDELPVFCVASILIMNRHKIIRETRSIDDMIKIFNDKLLKIHVRRCVRAAIKLRKKYFYKMIKTKSPPIQNGD
ncbi:Ypt/Rab-GAP domain of gyp1p superfamily protein [Euphorbia peplus]|nr:Ypt/Rab-GAP domain of gyp1p superfamily protein [Euphorbia peplus]